LRGIIEAGMSIKAFLTLHQISFRKSHNLTDLGSQCAGADPSLEPILREVAGLTDYATAFRYPDAPYEPDAPEGAVALAIAAKVCDEVKRRIEGGRGF